MANYCAHTICRTTEPCRYEALGPCANCGLDLADHDDDERRVCESQHRLHLQQANLYGFVDALRCDPTNH